MTDFLSKYDFKYLKMAEIWGELSYAKRKKVEL